MDTAPHVEVRVTQRFAVPPEQVFDAWLDPAIAGEWLFATAFRPAARVTIAAQVGGAFRFEDRHKGKDIVYAGEYVEIVRPRRLVFTLSEPQRPSSRVVVEIAAADKGCELALIQENVPPAHAARIDGRWAGMLYGLETILDHELSSR